MRALIFFIFLIAFDMAKALPDTSYIEYASLKTNWYEEKGRIVEVSLRTGKLFFDVKNRIVGIDNIKYHYEVVKTSEWKGITSLGFNFVLPKGWAPEEGVSWYFDGFAYRNKHPVPLWVNGRKIDVTPIRAINHDSKVALNNPMILLYSKADGLIGVVDFGYDEELSSYDETTYMLISSEGIKF
ncbi:hypothetical protein [Microbulbifer sp. VAAF005]|uniref:hypothetical protein n=1 Tax=Microbulbifer sp. VAAF005 TaxID=3034230 RepID=UPI0024ADE5AA|nr:hypothetical protein [Microbulbifer sp. VAAF005]WHI47987.1 hypothetical protein P0078_06285 [Microbulbifer sp. VAAF005]